MPDLNQLTSFLRDCLREERAGSGIPNLFSNKVLSRRFIKGEETATSHEFSSIDLPASPQESLITLAKLRGRDCELLYVTLPIVGKVKGRSVCAPLLLYPITLEDGTLRIEPGEVRINPAIQTLFDLPAEVGHALLDELPNGILGPVTPEILAKDLKHHFPDLRTDDLWQFPRLLLAKSVQEKMSDEGLSILPASVVVLAKRSQNVAGLLQELEILAGLPPQDYSTPLRVLLGDSEAAEPDSPHRGNPECIPALLSASQQNLLRSVNTHPLSVCQGPPGTGKSFSLVASAAEQILCGRSVLIACRSNEAADVLDQKLRELVPDSKIIVRAGRKKHLRELRSTIESILAEPSQGQPPALGSDLNPLIDQIYRTESRIRKEVETALATGEWFRNPPTSWWTKVRRWIHLKRLEKKPILAQAFELFYQLHHSRLREARIYNRYRHYENFREAFDRQGSIKTLKAYRDALKSILAPKQEEALQSLDPSLLFGFFPVWITTTDDLHRVLPLTRNLFDVAIIDEATQCDLASALPVLHRAKRALISGDPRQLRHLSFLSGSQLSALARKHDLPDGVLEQFNFRDVSLIDRALDQIIGTKAFTLLNEHFRSKPSLIRFSNQQFYHGALHLMRETEVLHQTTPSYPPLNITMVGGVRDSDGVNMTEIMSAIEICRSVSEGRSVGFISPFRAQVDAFLEKIQTDLSLEELRTLIFDNRLVAGTSHSFQGDERDQIILSLVIDDESPEGARRFLERPDVFNVAITRARDHMDVLHSVTPSQLPANSLIREYLLQSPAQKQAKGSCQTTLADLAPALGAIGWVTLPHNSISGIPTDLVLSRGGKIIAIDLIGTAGEEGQAVALSKSLILQRSGVPLYSIRLDEWLHCKNRIIEFFQGLGAESPS